MNNDGYDAQRGGLPVKSFDQMPTEILTAAKKHRFFDTRNFGKSAAGHDFPNVLTEPDRAAVLEYLKTL